MFRPIAAALAALVVAVPATAEAATLRGKTSQGRTITMKTGADGVPTSVRFRWNLSCKPTKVKGHAGSSFLRPFDQATPDVLNDADTVRRRVEGGYRMRTRASMSAQRSGATWSGTFSIQRQFSRRGKVVQTCTAENITWSVG